MTKQRARQLNVTNAFAVALLASTVLSTAAMAQTTPVPPTDPSTQTPATAEAPAAPAAAAQASKEIVVTGSRIRGVAPVGSSVQVLSTADIHKSGAITTTDLIQQIPQVFNLGVSESSRGQGGSAGSSNITYGTSINLRGIGPYTTLAIVNGHRVVPQGTSGFAVDPSVIPTLGLERVEIVADGSSAIYGSDAIAGVVNLILRRNFEGVEVNGRYGFANNYHERQVGLVAGHRWSTGQFTMALEDGFHTALNGRDRNFFRGDLTPFGGNDFRPTLCNPGNIIVAGVTYPIPAGGVTAANRNSLVSGPANKCDNLKIADLLPRQDHISGSFTLDQQLTDGVRVFFDGFATKRTFKIYGGAASSTLNVPSSNAFFVSPPAATLPLCAASAGAPAGSRCESVAYSFINDYPQGYSTGYSKSYNLHGGIEIKLPHDWRLEGDYGYGWDRDISISHNVANGAALTAALASSNPATAFNPFGGTNSPTVVNGILIGIGRNPGRTIFKTYEAKFNGPLVHLPGGDVRAAFGYEGQNQQVKQGLINGTITAPVDTERYFYRSVDSGYAELLVPLFGTANAIPGFQLLDIDAAIRYDHYSDVGKTTNPKIGANWSPVRGLTFRGSYGTSFRAPTISQIYGNTNTLFIQNYSDPTCSCIRQGVTRSGGNLNLKPETASTWSVGADLTRIPRLRASVTYWNIIYKNQVTNYLADLTILQRESQFAGTGIITRNPSPALIAAQIAETGFTGVVPNPVTLFVEGRSNNLGISHSQGIDFEGDYRLPTGFGRFDFRLSGTYFMKYRFAITPAAPMLNQLNLIFNPLRYRARGSVGWERGPLRATVFVNYENAYTNNLSTPFQRVRAYTPVDLDAAYSVPATNGALRNLEFSVHVRNLFNEKPPFVNIAQSANGGGGFDPTLANPVGRIVSIAVDKKF
ncbi:MAG: TonB-dependent receptor domain-containing protein [Sphingomicrobium sp.]